MLRTFVLVAFCLFASMAVADDDPLVARVIDEQTERTPKYTVVPKYPRKARRDRVEGEVQVCFDVDKKGRTRRIAVRRSSNRIFEKPSIRAIRASTFLPLQPGEELQAIKSCRTFVFSLVPVEE